jgi:hypothetical protein
VISNVHKTHRSDDMRYTVISGSFTLLITVLDDERTARPK